MQDGSKAISGGIKGTDDLYSGHFAIGPECNQSSTVGIGQCKSYPTHPKHTSGSQRRGGAAMNEENFGTRQQSAVFEGCTSESRSRTQGRPACASVHRRFRLACVFFCSDRQ